MYLSYLSEMLPLPPFPANGTSKPAAVTRTTTAGPPLLPNARLPNGLGCEQVSSRIVKADFTGAIIRGRSPACHLARRHFNLFVFFVFSCERAQADRMMPLWETVKKAKNPSLVGHSGIVIQETAETFKLVTPANIVKGTFRRVACAALSACS